MAEVHAAKSVVSHIGVEMGRKSSPAWEEECLTEPKKGSFDACNPDTNNRRDDEACCTMRW